MIKKTITFVPLLFQLFDEILVSAADIKGVKDILVNINVADNKIGVWTHGGGLDDINFSIIGEALGFGFVSVMNGDGNEVFKSIGRNLKRVRISENWCLVSFIPHLAHFGMECVKVRLAGTRFLPRTFEDYVDLYLQASGTYPTRIYEKLNDRWEICVATADLAFEHFDEVSFVNNIPTMEEGVYITSEITDYLVTIFNVEPNVIESYLWVFVNVHIHNPDSQTEDCELTPEFLKKIADSLKNLESLEDFFEKKTATMPLNKAVNVISTCKLLSTSVAFDDFICFGFVSANTIPLRSRSDPQTEVAKLSRLPKPPRQTITPPQSNTHLDDFEDNRYRLSLSSSTDIPETTFVGVESRVLIPETTVWDTLVYPSDTLVILRAFAISPLGLRGSIRGYIILKSFSKFYDEPMNVALPTPIELALKTIESRLAFDKAEKVTLLGLGRQFDFARPSGDVTREAVLYLYIAASLFRLLNYVRSWFSIINGFSRFYGETVNVRVPVPSEDAVQLLKYWLDLEIRAKVTFGMHIVSIVMQLSEALNCSMGLIVDFIEAKEVEKQVECLVHVFRFRDGNDVNYRRGMWRSEEPVKHKGILQIAQLAGSVSEDNKRKCVIVAQRLLEMLKSQRVNESIFIYNEARNNGLKPDFYTIPFVLKGVIGLRDSGVCLGKWVHCESIVFGLDCDVNVGLWLVKMYASFGCIEDARKVFDGMCVRDVAVWNAMVSGYCKVGEFEKARELFEVMEERNVVSWTALIAGYAQGNRACEAVEVFRRMRVDGVKPDEVTMVALLSACAQLGALELGEWVHG
ncbi:pentatricopeptide repeat-containing protein [Tanacetum coccineum]